MAYHVMLHPSLIALQKEIHQHPLLVEQLREHPNAGFGFLIGTVAAFVGIVCDGAYTPEEIYKLCDTCVRKLQEKRTIDINTKEGQESRIILAEPIPQIVLPNPNAGKLN